MTPDETTRLPSALPTVVVTLLLGLVGLVPMHLQTRAAARRGVTTERYWDAFVVAVVVNLVLVAALVLTVVLVVRHYVG